MAAFIGLDDNPTYTENGGLTVLDGDAALDGAATYNGAVLTLARQGGANPNDVFDGPFSDGRLYRRFRSSPRSRGSCAFPIWRLLGAHQRGPLKMSEGADDPHRLLTTEDSGRSRPQRTALPYS